jgi:hypothetical protein
MGDLFWRIGLQFPVTTPFRFFHGRRGSAIRRRSTLQLAGRNPCAMDGLMFLVSGLNTCVLHWFCCPLPCWGGGGQRHRLRFRRRGRQWWGQRGARHRLVFGSRRKA